MKKISIIIPVYNEEKFISSVLKQVFEADTLGLKKEVIVIDDGSTDKTTKLVKTWLKKKKYRTRLKLICKKSNQGKGRALKTGFLKSSGDIVLVQDADLEYNPEDYPSLIKPFLNNQADVVYGSRFITTKPRRVLYFWHYQVNIFLTLLSNLFTNLNLTDMETGYKLFRGKLIRDLAKNLDSRGFGFEPEITAKIAKIKGLKIYETGISYSGRSYQEGKKITWKDGFRAVVKIIKYNLLS